MNMRELKEKHANGERNFIGSNLRCSNLSCSDLSGSNLSHSNLSGSNLSYSNLSYSNLSGSDLSCSNLSCSDLRGSNLRGSNLIGSNLSTANLYDSIGNSREIKNIFIFEEYLIAYTEGRIQIGCVNHSIEEWRNFDDLRINAMDGKTALKFWRRNKSLIFQIIDSNPAVPTRHES